MKEDYIAKILKESRLKLKNESIIYMQGKQI